MLLIPFLNPSNYHTHRINCCYKRTHQSNSFVINSPTNQNLWHKVMDQSESLLQIIHQSKSHVTNSSTNQEPLLQTHGPIMLQDCERGSAKCFDIICELGELARKGSVVIQLRSRFWNSTFAEVSLKIQPQCNLRSKFQIIEFIS